jgi:hypothetical protein
MLVVKANTVIDSRGGIWTKEVVIRRRARLKINQNNETSNTTNISKFYYKTLPIIDPSNTGINSCYYIIVYYIIIVTITE